MASESDGGKKRFVVSIPLAGGGGWLDVAIVERPDYVADMVRALCQHGGDRVAEIRVQVLPGVPVWGGGA